MELMMAPVKSFFVVAVLTLLASRTTQALRCYQEFTYECSPPGLPCDLYMQLVSETPRRTRTCPSAPRPDQEVVCATLTFFLEEAEFRVDALVADCNVDESSLPDGCYGESGLDAIDPVGADALREVEATTGVTYQDLRICKCDGDLCNSGTIINGGGGTGPGTGTGTGSGPDTGTSSGPDTGTGSGPVTGTGSGTGTGDGSPATEVVIRYTTATSPRETGWASIDRRSLSCYRGGLYECTPPGLVCDNFMQNLQGQERRVVTCPSGTICATLSYYLTEGEVLVNALEAGCISDDSSLPSGCYDRSRLGQIDRNTETEIVALERRTGLTHQDLEVCKCERDLCNSGSLVNRGIDTDPGSESDTLRCYWERQFECTPPGLSCDMYLATLRAEQRRTVTCPANSVCASLTYYEQVSGLRVTTAISDCNVDESSLPDGCHDESAFRALDPESAAELDAIESRTGPTRQDFRVCKCGGDLCNRLDRDTDNAAQGGRVPTVPVTVVSIALAISFATLN